jgi:lipoyl(octanoyl) transferase
LLALNHDFMHEVVRVRTLGLQKYLPVWQELKLFTQNRDEQTVDEIWLLEHEAVYTQGQAGKPEHVLDAGDIPVIKSDRGGQVTYHGPGQLILYFLSDLVRKNTNTRNFINTLEQAVIKLLAQYNISANTKTNAPGVYVNDAKICSLGLRVRKGRTYHGLSLNVAMDLEPFSRINPCGFANMQMVNLSNLGGPASTEVIGQQLLAILIPELGYQGVRNEH